MLLTAEEEFASANSCLYMILRRAIFLGLDHILLLIAWLVDAVMDDLSSCTVHPCVVHAGGQEEGRKEQWKIRQ